MRHSGKKALRHLRQLHHTRLAPTSPLIVAIVFGHARQGRPSLRVSLTSGISTCFSFVPQSGQRSGGEASLTASTLLRASCMSSRAPGVAGDRGRGFELVEARYRSSRLADGKHFVQAFVNSGQDGGAYLGIAVGYGRHGGLLPIHPPHTESIGTRSPGT